MKKQFKVYFDKNGNQLTESNPIDWYVGSERDNYEFSASLQYQGWQGSRSGIFVIWSDQTGKQYKSSMVMLDEVLRLNPENVSAFLGESLIISGTFTFKKQGTAVLLTLKK